MASSKRSAAEIPGTCTKSDISQSDAFLDIKRRHEEFLQPSTGEVVDLSHVQYSPDGKQIAGVGTITKTLKGAPLTRLVVVAVDSGEITTFEEVGGSDIQPRWSPDATILSFLSQVDQCCQLHLLDMGLTTIQKVTTLAGTIEKQCWSPDGKSILLTVAGLGADKSGCDGGVSLVKDAKHDPAKTWLPIVEIPDEADTYRTAWVYNIVDGSSRQVSPKSLNVWVADWASNSSIVGVCSDSPGEEHWYGSTLREINIHDQTVRVIFNNGMPLEALCTPPSGAKAAFTTGVASDRQILRGDMYIIDITRAEAVKADTNGVNVANMTWASEDDIVAVGSRDDQEMLIHYNSSGRTVEIWQSREHSVGSYYMPDLTAIHDAGAIKCTFVRHGWFDPPTIFEASSSSTGSSELREIRVLSSATLSSAIKQLGTSESIKWQAPDGLDIYGYLLSPRTPGPHPTILFIHGGPVWQWRPRYLGSSVFVLAQALLEAGFAIFKPNVRGSSGRGQEFARRVYGDMGGLDTNDYLSGLDALVTSGKADPQRLGVTGASYGGYMSSWLVTQTTRFAAAVPVAPVTDWVSFQYTTHIGQFSRDFLNDDPHDPAGRFITRSPLHHVRKVKTPTMNICGAQDKNTPAGQAVEFHRGLVAHGVTSILLTYPEEGHGIRQMPAVFDYTARVVEWFKHFV
jgi:dipeptidyl aminopeptidase/acylaminoacyl peptidase